MVHRYLKTCVLSVCVAALCGGRAFGVWFWCMECQKPIWDGNWGSHCVEFQHGNKMPEWFLCNRCCVDKDGNWCNGFWHKDGRLDREQKIPSFEEHVQQEHRVWEYTFWCPKCEKKIDVNSWIMHLYWECKCYDGIYEFEKSDSGEETFRCSLCKKEEKEEAVFPLILKYEHLRDKHPECLPERKYFCKDCEKTVSKAEWQEHSKEEQTITFHCPICKEKQEERYEDHMAKYHNGKCPFCEEVFSEENRGQHMVEKHGFPCPICNKQVDTLLDVHVHRQHPYFEGPCRCQKFRSKMFKPCEYPSYLVSGWDYIQHLTSGVHRVGANNENIESFFAWCPRNDFLGPFEKMAEHASLKHKGCFFCCPKCLQVDYACGNKELHFQVRHDKTHWRCRDCAQVFQYESEDKEERLAFEFGHLLTVHEKCPVCGDAACKKDLDSHSRAKHPKKRLFWCFACNACKAGDQSQHMEKTHGRHYCKICDAVFQYESEDAQKRLAFRYEHLLTVHKKCPVCGDAACKEDLDSHSRAKHPEKFIFWCFACNACKAGDQSKHMVRKHGYHYCEICCEAFNSNPFDHHNEKHEDFFFCQLCLESFRDRLKHIKSVHSKKAEWCVCGELLLSYEVKEDWHVAKHPVVHCTLCNKSCSPKHMVEEHKCKKGACRPMVSTMELIWKWQCDPFHHCPLRSWGCEFTSEMGQLNEHMRNDHKCKATCRFDNKSKGFVHGASCQNGPAFCSLCKCDVANRAPHWIKDHGCKKGCLIAMGKGKWHQADCEKWTLAQCPVCKEDNVDRNHIFQKHFSACGENGCYLIQDNSENGCVSIHHQGHSNGEEEFALQDYPEEEIEIDYNPD